MQRRPGCTPGNAPTLVTLHGPGEPRSWPLEADVTTLGRARGCDLCLEASDISTIHCVVFRSRDGYQVRDCNSRSGTRLNGDAVRGCTALHDGDVLQVGPFSFEVKLGAHLGQADTAPSHAGVAAASAAEPAADAAWAEQERQLADQRESLRCAQQEFDGMKQQFENGQVEANAALEQQRAALARQEAAIRTQRAELARMMGELRHLQEELRKPQKAELQKLADENDRLRQSVAEYEARLAEPRPEGRDLEEARAENDLLREMVQEREREITEHLAASAAPSDPEPLRAENALLKQLLAEKDQLVEELRTQAVAKPAKSANELERYEAELNEYRKQMETQQAKLNAEIEQMRVRNEELDEATREMEMAMSRERAELGRERIRMERMRDELRADMEKLQRESSVRQSLAPVQRLRDEMAHKAGGGKPAPDGTAERLRSLRAGNDTPRPG